MPRCQLLTRTTVPRSRVRTTKTTCTYRGEGLGHDEGDGQGEARRRGAVVVRQVQRQARVAHGRVAVALEVLVVLTEDEVLHAQSVHSASMGEWGTGSQTVVTTLLRMRSDSTPVACTMKTGEKICSGGKRWNTPAKAIYRATDRHRADPQQRTVTPSSQISIVTCPAG